MATFLYLVDSGAQTWQVAVANDGTLNQTAVATVPPSASTLNDFLTNTTTWTIGISTFGVLFVTGETYDGTQPLQIVLNSPDSTEWAIRVDLLGNITTTDISTPPTPPPGPCGTPGNITVTANTVNLVVLPRDVTLIGDPFLLAIPYYKYANLDLPFSPNDPGLFFTVQDPLLHETLAARFFNLLDEYSEPLFFNPAASGGQGCLDPRDFGAVGDGITNDTAAVQAAFNKARDNAAPIASGGFAIGPTTVCIPTGETCLVGGWIDVCAAPFGNLNTDLRSEEFPIGLTEAIAMYPNTSLSVDGALVLMHPENAGAAPTGMQCPQLCRILLGGPFLPPGPLSGARKSATHDIHIYGAGVIDGGAPEPRSPNFLDWWAFNFDGLYNCIFEGLTIQNCTNMFMLSSTYGPGGNLNFRNLNVVNCGMLASINGYVSPSIGQPMTATGASGYLQVAAGLDANLTIVNCNVQTSASGGSVEFDTIDLNNYRNIIISNNIFGLNGGSGFPIGMSLNGASHPGATIGLSQVTISNNNFLNFYTAIVFVALGLYQGVSITDNIFTTIAPTIFGECITLAGSVIDGLSISGNSFSGYAIAVFGDAIMS